jgi:hypothetical protein
MLLLVRRYAVNVLYYDQWNYYAPLFDGGTAWDFFSFQNGPVRQGVGFLAYKPLAELTAWDARAEGYASCAVVFAALLVALLLRRRLFGPLRWWDAVIPAVFLNPTLTGAYTYIPNPSHGPFPVLLVMLYCLAWCWRSRLRYAAVALLNFLLVYTTFGLLVGFITPPLLLLDARRAWRVGGAGPGPARAALAPLLALGASLLSLGAFFVGYRSDPAAACFHFPHERPLDYFGFAGMMFASFWRAGGAGRLAPLLGAPLVLLTAAVCARRAALLLLRDRGPARERDDARAGVVIVTLAGFSVLFAAGAAVGRVCVGLSEATSARYMPYVIPAALALYFELLTLKEGARGRAAGLAAFAAGAALMTAPLLGGGAAALEEARRGKEEWRRCYLETESVGGCDARSGFTIYETAAGPDDSVERRLDYLKRRRLSLYAGD